MSGVLGQRSTLCSRTVSRWTVQRYADGSDFVGIDGRFYVFMDYLKVRTFACHDAGLQRYTSLSKGGFPQFNSH
jgi:hypothetical protein